MCGITGIYAFNMVGRVSMINVAKATSALEKRGPDVQNTYNDHSVALGHRRLSIIDPTPEGHQPMFDQSGRYVIAFNGEIFNFKSIKQELQAQGHTFRSQTDTEVLLQLFIKEGKDCLQKLNGFFSFAIWDTQDKSLFIARDRIGIKPLYYMMDDDRLLFGSELKAIEAYGIDKELDYTALNTYLQLNYIPAPRTIFKNVKKLMPGHYIELTAERFEVKPYYTIPSPSNDNEATSYEDQKNELSQLLEASVQKRLMADVPLGSFLSGGIDSSVVSTLAARHKPDLHTFSIGYQDEKFFDESEYAQLVAKKIGTNHTVFSLTNQQMYAHLHDILDYMDEPFADSSAIAVYVLSQETRKHATVALSGDGADELFAGYNKHAAFFKIIEGGKKAEWVKNLGPIWGLMPKSRNNKITNLFRQLHRFSEGMKLNSQERYWRWAGFASESEVSKLLTPAVKGKINQEEYLSFKNDILQHLPEKESINDILYTDVKLVLPDDMLTKVDRMSMANSLEVRVPFLDHEVVEFAFRIPPSSKINTDIRKRILQDTFRDILPQELYNRPKKGFEVPLSKWLRTDMKSMITEDLLNEKFIADQGIFDVKAIKSLKKQLFSSNPGDAHARIWSIIVFQWWWKKYMS
ncbi:asparagine synthase (glutamine-hydrolyzing) [Fulvivirga sediminis]|uniref:asparagine synthase (glutamine-hydrolyzing) n=1 Tax=Fulvivirga sediminis TaxID=2803949 RepID=A0A937F8J4_9BACT|nr:asparagine synthase (glutamine-hydrolyzing) [Fulvivirga sediminis]MBL3656254.1 asparagine synthase (glutamine-hydrolyzing) [Fulvivirga sediminis]